MHFLPEQLANLSESSDRRGRVRRNPSAVAYLEAGESNGGIVLNVSETGLAIAVAQSFGDTHIPILSFRLPQLDRTFQAAGEIVWRSESKKTVGVRFVNLAEHDRVQIRNWIRAEIVAAELGTPRESDPGQEAAKAVLIMPSPRKVARQVEAEAARDEARAAEFDRMFPSETTLNTSPMGTESGLDSEIAQAAKAANAANALLAHEESSDVATGPQAPVVELESTLLASHELQVAEPAALQIAAETDWRGEWERFHVQRESLERARTFEMTVPTPMRSIIGESIFGRPHAIETAAPAEPAEGAGVAGATRPGEQPGRIIADHVDVITPSETVGIARQGEPKKSTLGIAALSGVLVALCFVLGYAIQPGAFRFVAATTPDPSEEVPAAAKGSVAQESLPPATVSSSVNDASNSAAANSAPRPAPLETRAVASPENSEVAGKPTDTGAIRSSAAVPAVGTVTTTPALANPAPQPAPAEPRKLAPSVPSAPSSEIVISAPVPVSFFPVTAPSGGSPAKMMQLPEETISETPAVVIRSRQFLFVPAQPGPESTHELERVHIGDRVVKVDPAYPLGGPGNSAGGTVHLRTTIGTDGAISNVQPISGPTSLITVAASAVRQWRYKPTDIDGKPIAVEEDVILEFRPSH
jgi:PilZ domain/Gram-negative bacterial TonB protein C-terminal